MTSTPVPAFIQLDHSAVNPAAVAYYEFLDEKLKLVMVSGAMLELEGSEAAEVYVRLRALSAPSLLSEEQQTALKVIRGFLYGFKHLPEALEEAFSTLGA